MQSDTNCLDISHVVLNLNAFQAHLSQVLDLATVIGGDRSTTFHIHIGRSGHPMDFSSIEERLLAWAQELGNAAEQRAVIKAISLGAQTGEQLAFREFKMLVNYYQMSRVSGGYQRHS